RARRRGSGRAGAERDPLPRRRPRWDHAGDQPRRRPDDRGGTLPMRIVLAEDSLLLREGVAQLLALEGHEIVDGTSNATELLHSVAQHAPDLAIVDVRMPPDFVDEGVHAALQIRRDHP